MLVLAETVGGCNYRLPLIRKYEVLTIWASHFQYMYEVVLVTMDAAATDGINRTARNELIDIALKDLGDRVVLKKWRSVI